METPKKVPNFRFISICKKKLPANAAAIFNTKSELKVSENFHQHSEQLSSWVSFK